MSAEKDPRFLHRIAVTSDAQAITVFRFVHASALGDVQLRADFLSDRAAGKPRRGRARSLPDLWDGLSCFRTLDLAQTRWADIAALAQARGEEPRVGSFVAQVELAAGRGFAYEDLGGDDGHLTVWGDPSQLAEAAAGIFDAHQ